MSKIIGATVGTTTSPRYMERKIGPVKTINGMSPDGNGDVDLSASVYDLKEGYAYLENVRILEDGTPKLVLGQNYKLLDYIPVKKGISYTMYGCGYALYDKKENFLSAVCDPSGKNRIRELTPAENGFVRLNINCEDIAYARFCRTDEKHLEPCDYDPKMSPFFDPKIPCEVHLYGDSNSEGYGLDDPAKSWANRLGGLIISMKSTIFNRHFAAFADKSKDSNFYILNDTGYLRFTAYTNAFGVTTADVGEIAVYIDGQQQDSIVQPGNAMISFDGYGKHTIELYGVSGTNAVTVIATKKQRTFENHAVFGSMAEECLPTDPVGNVAIVMYGTNDRMLQAGYIHRVTNDFVRRCKAVNVIPYIFTPVPPNIDGETDPSYKQSINDIIAQLPSDCINVYEEMQLVEMLCGDTIFADNLHLSEFGHKVLYVVAASKLQLAPHMSEVLHKIVNVPDGGTVDLTDYATKKYVEDAIANIDFPTVEDYTLPIANHDTLGGVKPVTKSDDMTQSVGVDESGGLWTVPGIGGSGGGNANICTITAEQGVDGITVELPTTLNKFCIIEFRIVFGEVLLQPMALYSRQGSGNYHGYSTALPENTKAATVFGLRFSDEYLHIGFNSAITYEANAFAKIPSAALRISQTEKTITFYSNTSGVNFPAGTSISVWGVYEK